MTALTVRRIGGHVESGSVRNRGRRLPQEPGHGFEEALEDVFALFDDGVLGPAGVTDPAAFPACFARHERVMVSLRGRDGGPA